MRRPAPVGIRAAVKPLTPECAALDRKVAAYSMSAVLLGALGAAGGGASPALDDVAAKWSVAGVGAAATIAAAGLGWAASWNAAKFARECAQ